MINILSYVGMNLQSEVCLWTLLGLLRTIFDATLFKVWQMKMPVELTLPVQRVLRTMISSVMLVQCFTVYVYLASYIVLLYPVFLEERPTLVLPWLLLAAIRNFLCELTSLALGLGTCVLLGPARPPCIRFVILKLALIMPAFYMWMLILGYYHNLKMASAFKTFPTVLPAQQDLDYGVELAVRRRRTKSLQGEDQLRKKLIASLYGQQNLLTNQVAPSTLTDIEETDQNSQVVSVEDIKTHLDTQCPLTVISNRTMSDIGTYEDWFGSEVVVPRDTDRILEQFVLMLLRIGVFLGKEDTDLTRILNSTSQSCLPRYHKVMCPAIPPEETETPPLVGSSKGRIASYLREYPQIFMKKPSDILGPMNSIENRLPITQTNSSTQSADAESRIEDQHNTVSIAIKTDLLKGKSSHSLIHSQEELNDSTYSKSKIIENINNSSENSKERILNDSSVNSTISMQSVINRIQILAACKQLSDDEDSIKQSAETSSSNRNQDNHKSTSKENERKSKGTSNVAQNNLNIENNRKKTKSEKNNKRRRKS